MPKQVLSTQNEIGMIYDKSVLTGKMCCLGHATSLKNICADAQNKLMTEVFFIDFRVIGIAGNARLLPHWTLYKISSHQLHQIIIMITVFLQNIFCQNGGGFFIAVLCKVVNKNI